MPFSEIEVLLAAVSLPQGRFHRRQLALQAVHPHKPPFGHLTRVRDLRNSSDSFHIVNPNKEKRLQLHRKASSCESKRGNGLLVGSVTRRSLLIFCFSKIWPPKSSQVTGAQGTAMLPLNSQAQDFLATPRPIETHVLGCEELFSSALLDRALPSWPLDTNPECRVLLDPTLIAK